MSFYEAMGERIIWAMRSVVAYGLITVLLLSNLIAVPAPLSLMFQAPFFLMALYYWTMFRPTLLPAWMVFVAGLLVDIIGYYPLGLNAVLFLVCRIVIFDQRKFLMAQSFQMNWMGFMVMHISYLTALWAGYSLARWQFMSVSTLIWPLVLGALFYPLVFWFLHLSHKLLPVSVSQKAGNLNSQRKGMSL